MSYSKNPGASRHAAAILGLLLVLVGGCSDSGGPTVPQTSIMTVTLRVSLTAPARAQVLALELDGQRIFTLDRSATGGCRTCFLSAVSPAVPSGEHELRVVAVEHTGGTPQDDVAGYFWLGTLSLVSNHGGNNQLIDLEGARPISNGGSFLIARFTASG